MKKFEDLTHEELIELRSQVVLGSMFVSDYVNTFGFNAHDMSYFFDGYVEYILELMAEDNAEESQFDEYDNANNLIGWYYCYDDFSWVRMEDDE
jgi:hypothetical protein